MSMLVYFTVLLAIIGYQIIQGRREYAQKQQRQAEQARLLAEKSTLEQIKNKRTEHYAITPRESLAPQLQPKRTQQPKRINQS